MRKIQVIIAIAALGLMFLVAGYFTTEAQAQDNNPTAIKRVSKKHPPLDQFIKLLTSKLKGNGVISGPLDIIVGATDRGANGMKYSNVPYAIVVEEGTLAFPSGNLVKGDQPEIIITTNFTVRTKS